MGSTNKPLISCLALYLFIIAVTFLIQSSNAATYNVIRFGARPDGKTARPDGKTDSTKAFLNAWRSACNSAKASTIHVPKGWYLIRAAEFRGPCKSRINIKIDGTIVAPDNYRAVGKSGYRILFIKVDNLSVFGGRFDAKAAGFWACRRYGKNCPEGARVSNNFESYFFIQFYNVARKY